MRLELNQKRLWMNTGASYVPRKEGWMGRRSLSDGFKTLQTKSGHRRCLCVIMVILAVRPLNSSMRIRGPFEFTQSTWVHPLRNFRTQRLPKRLEELYVPKIFDVQNARLTSVQPQVEFDLSYTDTALISLSTTVLFNYPFPGFAKLPLSLIISLEFFSCKVGGGSLSWSFQVD